MAPAMAIDGDPSTKWDGNLASGHWLQVDMGRRALIGGVILQWDEAYAPEYKIEYSVDGQHWQTAFQTSDSLGGVDYVLFPSVRARYLRLASPPNSERRRIAVRIELLASESPRITGAEEGLDSAGPWSATVHSDLVELVLEMARVIARIFRARPGERTGSVLNSSRERTTEGRDPAGEWHLLGDDASPLGDSLTRQQAMRERWSELRLRSMHRAARPRRFDARGC
jgi:hypothetical protein